MRHSAADESRIMTIDEIKALAAKRKQGEWQFEDWAICASDNWDKLMAVVEAAEKVVEDARNVVASEGDHYWPELERSLEAYDKMRGENGTAE
jgi:hypothetical protein